MPGNTASSDSTASQVGVILAAVLGLEEGTTLDEDTPMEQHGLASLQSMDLIVALEETFGIRLAETATADHPTINALASHVRAKLAARAR